MTDDALTLRPCRDPAEWPRLVAIWRRSVEATHDFLEPADVDGYERRIASDFLPALEVTVAMHGDVAVGFSGIAEDSLEMLFVDARFHGRGAGSLLLRDALARHPQLQVDVNEQNPGALAFYQRHGMVQVGRSDLDGDERPFPLLHLIAGPRR